MNDQPSHVSNLGVPRWIRTLSFLIGTVSVVAGILWTVVQAGTALNRIAMETDVRIMQLFVTELLPEISGAQERRLNEECFNAKLGTMGELAKINYKTLNGAAKDCTYVVPGDRTKQVAASWAVASLVKKYDVLCLAVRKTIDYETSDDELREAAKVVSDRCPRD